MFKNLIIAFMCLSALFNSCTVSDSVNEKQCITDSINKDIPPYKKTFNSNKIKEKIERLAGLTNLENGFNGLEIRIWFAYSSNTEHLIILNKINGKWAGTVNTLTYNYHSKVDTLVSIHRTAKQVEPKSDWKTFTDSLINLGILALPDMTEISGYTTGSDGNWLTVEYADCQHYRYYSYQTPWGYADEFWQAKKVVNISKLIEDELNFDRFLKTPN